MSITCINISCWKQEKPEIDDFGSKGKMYFVKYPSFKLIPLQKRYYFVSEHSKHFILRKTCILAAAGGQMLLKTYCIRRNVTRLKIMRQIKWSLFFRGYGTQR